MAGGKSQLDELFCSTFNVTHKRHWHASLPGDQFCGRPDAADESFFESWSILTRLSGDAAEYAASAAMDGC
jgi:hypothetical protein